MFFLVSKLLGFFALPSNAAVLLGLVGLVLLLTPFVRTGQALLVAGLLLVAVLGWSPLGNALTVPLEERFPPWQDGGGGPITGVVVLGGSVTADVSTARNVTVLNEAAERLTAAAALARKYPQAKIIHSGGDNGLLFTSGVESVPAMTLLADLGVPADRLIAEDRSRNTVENALFTKRIADPKPGERWLLVTSAYHMPRAIGVFRKVGFPVEPYPVDWRTRGRVDLYRPFFSIGDGLRRTDTAVREWVGLVVYRVTGRTASLFPGPDGD